MSGRDDAVEQHYTRQGLGETILAALEAAGKELVALGRNDLGSHGRR